MVFFKKKNNMRRNLLFTILFLLVGFLTVYFPFKLYDIVPSSIKKYTDLCGRDTVYDTMFIKWLIGFAVIIFILVAFAVITLTTSWLTDLLYHTDEEDDH